MPIDHASLRPFRSTTTDRTDLPGLGEKYAANTRDVYTQEEKNLRILIATDRQSAFDRLWCAIPLKGQVLNQLSAWWFSKVAHVMPNHVVEIPDPNVTVAKRLTMLKVEIIVRGYLTGSTETSAWVNYRNGVRNFCGNALPEGMVKNQPFQAALITPTTKGEKDELIDPAGIVERGLATAAQWEEIADRALALFAEGQRIAAEKGLILVDTKYEMGVDAEGRITLADEVHTPDSSRYWVAATYAERHAAGQEPESLDKEFFRLWLKSQGFEEGKEPPAITDDVRLQLAGRYIDLYERMTGETFVLPQDADVPSRIRRNLASYGA